MSSSSTTEKDPSPSAASPEPESASVPAPSAAIPEKQGPQERREFLRLFGIFGSLVLVVALPFLLRPPENQLFADATESLVIISPHNDSIRTEFALAFALYMKERTGTPVRIDWRDAGGTSEISKFIDSSFQAAFDRAWRSVPNRRWNDKTMHSPGEAAIARDVPDDTPADEHPGPGRPAGSSLRQTPESASISFSAAARIPSSSTPSAAISVDLRDL